MRLQSVAIVLVSLIAMPSARTEETVTMTGSSSTLAYADVRKVAPALEALSLIHISEPTRPY